MLLATAPHRRLSTAPSAVIERIGAIRPDRSFHGIAPSWSRSAWSSVCGIAPMTGTGQCNTALSAVARMMPSSEAGKRSDHFLGHRSMVRITTVPSTTACQSTVKPPRKKPKNFSVAECAPGVWIPRKLSIWPMKMIKAMPEVKPVITGAGTKAMKRPSRSRPMTSSRTPAIAPASQMPVSPYCWASTISTALIAPVGPEIWYGAPESAPMTSPAKIAVTSPAAALAPDATPNARANGSATAATVRPASRSWRNLLAL